jgi:FMN-dependent NADH-azoreductase
MPRLLHIQSSPNLENSITRRLSDRFVAAWRETHHNVEVELLDLVTDPIPHFGPEMMGAAAPEAEWSVATRAAVARSDALIEQLKSANVLVIGAPMINFTICTQLKAWFDHITIAGKSFQYAAPGVAKGLMFGIKTYVIEGRGGDYADVPMNAFDFQEPLLRMLLGFLGIYDVQFIRAEGTRQRPEEAADIVRNTEAIIDRMVV